MTLNLQEIRRKYPSIYDVDVLFTNGESMNIGKDIVIVDYKDLNDMIPDLAGITLDGVPTYLQPYNVIISIFPSNITSTDLQSRPFWQCGYNGIWFF